MRTVLCLWMALSVTAAVGCGDDDGGVDTGISIGSDGGAEVCEDNDGDGYGVNCNRGVDCDDEDPAITTQCVQCLRGIVEGCPCVEGTQSVSCTPPKRPVTGGNLVCEDGTRYCRNGLWGGCETIGQYVFVADGIR